MIFFRTGREEHDQGRHYTLINSTPVPDLHLSRGSSLAEWETLPATKRIKRERPLLSTALFLFTKGTNDSAHDFEEQSRKGGQCLMRASRLGTLARTAPRRSLSLFCLLLFLHILCRYAKGTTTITNNNTILSL